MKKRMAKLLSMCLISGLVLSQPMAVLGAQTEEGTLSVESEAEMQADENETENQDESEVSPEKESDLEEPEEESAQEGDVAVSDQEEDEKENASGDTGDAREDEEISDKEEEPEEDKGPLKGKWERNAKGWWFQITGGKWPSDGIFEIEEGTKTVRYAFDKNGYMITGWYKEAKADNSGVDWYYFNDNGSMREGWVQVKNIWYYLEPGSGIMSADCQETIKGKDYAFTSSGAMIVGWHKTPDKIWYFFDKSGAMVKGWLKDGNTWYYLDPSTGAMYSDGINSVGDKQYAFKSSGAMITGWYKEAKDGGSGVDWYYFGANGAMCRKWLRDGTTWYYLDPDTGVMHYSTVEEIGGKTYAFKSSGAMIVGWYSEVDAKGYKWYYFSKVDGSMCKGWEKDGDVWYYLEPDTGVMYANGLREINGKWYGFTAAGVMATGWYQQRSTDKNGNVGNYWYYFNKKNGDMCKGWVNDGSAWYYMDPDTGIMYAGGTIEINGSNSKFDNNGKWLGYVK